MVSLPFCGDSHVHWRTTFSDDSHAHDGNQKHALSRDDLVEEAQNKRINLKCTVETGPHHYFAWDASSLDGFHFICRNLVSLSLSLFLGSSTLEECRHLSTGTFIRRRI